MLRSGHGITILAYHDISEGKYLYLSVPEKVFKMHIKFLLKNKYNIISLKRAVMMLKTGERIPKKTVVITFDDGYKSMFTTVFPLVKKYQIPITIFLSVEPLITGRPLFVDALTFAFENTLEKKLNLTSFGLQQYSLDIDSERLKAISDIDQYGKRKCHESKEQIIASVFSALKIDREDSRLKNLMLNWNEVKEMHKHGVSFGAHTISHPNLTNISEEEARTELSESKKIIEKNIGENVDFFAYPYGSRDSYNLKIRKMVEENGFTAACILTSGVNKAGEDLFLLKRTNITYADSLKPHWLFVRPHFSVTLSGFYERIVKTIKNTVKVKSRQDS
jgi:peptidoglycan/xylan/chitin deacetylase (PgdA/CDA1 family)